MADITIKALSYRTANFALGPITHRFTGGGLHLLLGRNGAGKSTLLRMLAGALRPHQGAIYTAPHARLSYVPQQPTCHWAMRVADVVALGGYKYHADINKAAHATRTTHLLDRSVDALSGGEMARVHLARALAIGPDILLLDEALNGLDFDHQAHMLDILADVAQSGTTIILATHDVLQAAPRAKAIHLLRDGQITDCGGWANAVAQHGLAQHLGMSPQLAALLD